MHHVSTELSDLMKILISFYIDLGFHFRQLWDTYSKGSTILSISP